MAAALSLRQRLLVGVAVVAFVLVGTALLITRTTQSHLVHQVDAQLRSAGAPARDYGGHGPRGRPGGGLGGWPGGGGGPGPVGGSGDDQPDSTDDTPTGLSSLYAAVVHSDGTLTLLSTPNLSSGDVALPAIDAELVRTAFDSRDEEPFTTGSDGSDLQYRVLVTEGEQSGDALVLALPLDNVDAAVSRLIQVEVAATAVIVSLLALVTWWVIRLGVRPIKQMTATATAIAGGDLTPRVPDVVAGTEAGELGLALNQMLGRIEGAFEQRRQSEARLRQFVADASHELRTPVATIRGYAELYRTGALDAGGELDEAMRRTEQEAIRMGSLVDDLLLLARLDQGRPLDRSPVDLLALVSDAVRDASAVEPDRPITAQVKEAVVVPGDDSRLRQVISNLVRNAMIHTPAQTPVTVRLGREGGDAVVDVVDEGPGMPEEVVARAFERFYRADRSRARSRGGTGLGLAIVQATVHAHGGTVSIVSRPGEGTTVQVRLPIDGDPGPAPVPDDGDDLHEPKANAKAPDGSARGEPTAPSVVTQPDLRPVR